MSEPTRILPIASHTDNDLTQALKRGGLSRREILKRTGVAGAAGMAATGAIGFPRLLRAQET